MKKYVCVNEICAPSDSEAIIASIELAVKNGTRAVRIPRLNERTGEELWVIDKTIELPSDIEIFIDDAHLVLATGTYINMFTAIAKHGHDGSEKSDAIKNVWIHGSRRATIDGGEYNGLSEKNFKSRGIDIYRNTSLLFFNVDGLTVENVAVINQRWWGITNVFVSNAVFRNIRFQADFSRIDENGVHYPNEKPQKYTEVYIRNADGIDLRIGCHHILIENITGFTQDDSVALTALGTGEINRGMFIGDAETAIHDVKIKNVVTDSYCSNIRLLNGNGHKMYNVEIDGISSLLSDNRTCDHCFTNRNGATVRIGDIAYTTDHPDFDDMKNITIRNVNSETNCAITLCNAISDLTIENVVANGGYAVIGTHRAYFPEGGAEEFASSKNLVCEVLRIADPEPHELKYVNYRARIRNFRLSNVATVSEDTVEVQNQYLEFVD